MSCYKLLLGLSLASLYGCRLNGLSFSSEVCACRCCTKFTSTSTLDILNELLFVPLRIKGRLLSRLWVERSEYIELLVKNSIPAVIIYCLFILYTFPATTNIVLFYIFIIYVYAGSTFFMFYMEVRKKLCIKITIYSKISSKIAHL